jgi:hypothetical protein
VNIVFRSKWTETIFSLSVLVLNSTSGQAHGIRNAQQNQEGEELIGQTSATVIYISGIILSGKNTRTAKETQDLYLKPVGNFI